MNARDRLDAAEYEVGRAMADANEVVADRRHTAYRRRLAGQESSLGYAIVKLIEEWRRTHTLRVTLGAGYASVEVQATDDPDDPTTRRPDQEPDRIDPRLDSE